MATRVVIQGGQKNMSEKHNASCLNHLSDPDGQKIIQRPHDYQRSDDYQGQKNCVSTSLCVFARSVKNQKWRSFVRAVQIRREGKSTFSILVEHNEFRGELFFFYSMPLIRNVSFCRFHTAWAVHDLSCQCALKPPTWWRFHMANAKFDWILVPFKVLPTRFCLCCLQHQMCGTRRNKWL